MTDEQTEKGKIVVPIEIVISSQQELDKLLDDNYNALDKVAVIDKDLKIDSSRSIIAHDTAWKEGKAFFKHAIECKNIDAGLMKIESSSKITAHNITAWTINSTNIRADNLDCRYLKAKTVSAHSTTAGRIESNSVHIRNMPTLFYSYDFWDTKG
jgi:viroplasmin and RNaseH domain-containing protein